MFEEIGGLPLHPLLIHATVVFVPLQILLSLGYALLPFLRRATLWAVVILSILGPVSAAASKLSGDAFRQRKVDQGIYPPEFFVSVDNHRSYGNLTLYTSIGLAVLTLLLVALVRGRAKALAAADGPPPPPAAKILIALLTILVVGAGGAAGFYVFKTGDTGARMVWSNQ